MRPSHSPTQRRILLLVSLLSWSLAASLPVGPSFAQVTNTTDDDPPITGSLRQQVEASAPGATIAVQLGTNEEPTTDPDTGMEEPPTVSEIALSSTLTFDNTVTIDNSNTAFGPTTVRAPDDGAFLAIEPGVHVVLRDVGLAANGLNNDDAIELQDAASRLTFDLNRGNQTVSADIIGLGALVKSGTSSLTLSGFNDFEGGLTIQRGDVIGDSASLGANDGTSVINLAPAGAGATARIVFNVRGNDFLDSNSPMIKNLSTSGGVPTFVKAGSGTLDLADPDSSDMVIDIVTIDPGIGIQVDDGNLIVDQHLLASGHNYSISTPGTLLMTYGGVQPGMSPLDFSGSLAGSGAVYTDVPDLDLTGDLSAFTGVLEIDDVSSVQVAPTVAPSGPLGFDVELDTSTTIIAFDNDVPVTYSGNVSGAGTLVKQGSGTTELTGTATQSATTVVAGTLIGNTNNLQGPIDVQDGITLGFRQNNNGSFGGTIGTAGNTITVQKLGPAQLTLTSDQPFGGTVDVQAGGLFFAQDVDLPNAGLTVGTVAGTSSASLGAAFDPSPGADNTISIGGALAIRSDAAVSVNLDDATGSSTIFAATGPVSIDPAARLTVFLQPGTYAPPNPAQPDVGPSFVILTGANVTGDFDIQQDLFFFDVVGSANTNPYTIRLDPSGNSFAGTATSSNQLAVGTQLDILRTGPNGGDADIQNAQNTLTITRASDVRDILETVSPDDLAIPTHTELAAASRTWRSLSNRLALMRNQGIGHHNTREGRRQRAREDRERRLQIERERRARERGEPRPSRPSVDAPPAAAQPLPQEKPWVAWLDVSGSLGQLDSNEAKDYEYKRIGPLIGADTSLTPNFRIGLATGATYSDYEATDGLDSKGNSTAVEGVVYGAWIGDPVEVLIGGRYAHSWVDSDRRGRFQTASGDIKGDHEGDIYGAYLELTRSFLLPYDIDLAPIASVAYTHLAWDAFDESGNNPLAMQVDESTTDSALTGLGFRISTQREMNDGFVIRPRFKALWNHEWADQNREVTGSFASAPITGGGDFTVQGAEVPRDFAEVSAGWEIGYNTNANLFIDWDGRFGKEFVENSLSIGVRIAW